MTSSFIKRWIWSDIEFHPYLFYKQYRYSQKGCWGQMGLQIVCNIVPWLETLEE